MGGGASRYYWSVDIPGMTAEQAARVAAFVEEQGWDDEPGHAIVVDPASFLTLHMDADTVRTLVAGLDAVLATGPEPGSAAMRAQLTAWLASAGETVEGS